MLFRSEYLEHSVHGPSWKTVHEQWKVALAIVAKNTAVRTYTSTSVVMKAGRKYNYDADVTYHNEGTVVATRKIEFKYGAANICELPQILSLQAKMNLFENTYDVFYYKHYIDKYLACDSELSTVEKPSLDVYLKHVTRTTYSTTPFFEKLKERELSFETEKDAVVNQSIADYLATYAHTINLSFFSDKLQTTQRDKIYLLWSKGTFHYDTISDAEMTGIAFQSIRKGNVLVLQAGQASYELLLRWRNHKGILNPAWQISMKH